jgi:hypothetical protein
MELVSAMVVGAIAHALQNDYAAISAFIEKG